MKYTITFSCGHTETIELLGKVKDRERKIEYFKECGLCPHCYQEAMDKKNSNGCEEVEMKYSEYKNHYDDCKTKSGSYNDATKTIIVYVPKKDETVINAENEAIEALSNLFGEKYNESEIKRIKAKLHKIDIYEYEKALEQLGDDKKREVYTKQLEIIKKYKMAVKK